MILAGDIGGTSTRLALFEVNHDQFAPIVNAKFPSREHRGLDEIVRKFVADQQTTLRQAPIEHVAFGIAGPVRGGKVHASNLPWIVDAAQLGAELSVADVHLLNDLEANAHGIPALAARDLVTLNAGQPEMAGDAAIISAGTGLGEASIYNDGRQLRPSASEGGHSDFCPRDELESELLLHLKQKFAQQSGGHVSYERVLSGPGLLNIYEFLRDTGRGMEPPKLEEAMRDEDPSAAISQAAFDGSSPLCARALDMFVSFYGAEAGNLALKVLATRALYIGGGIAPKIIAKLREPPFLESFLAKGRLRPLMEKIPVHVIMNEHTALLGAARFAAVQAGLLPPWSD